MTGNAVLDAAFKRAAILGALLGALAFIGARQQDINWENSIYAGLTALIGCLVVRGMGEGGIDARRAQTGNMNDGDVPIASDKVIVTDAPGA